MTTPSVTTIPLEAVGPAQRLRRTAAAVRVMLHWWGVHRALTPQQREEIGSAASADARFLTAGKKLIDVRHEAFRTLTGVRTRIGSYWRGISLPYVEPGVRLIRQSDIEPFVHTMEGFRGELRQAEADLNAAYGQVKADARRRLGRLYNPDDYPPEVVNLFGVEWDFPSVEPPSYLMRIAPEVYEEERQRVASRFDEAVRLAEQAFATEFARLLAHLTARLVNGEGGQRQVFRDSVVNNLTEFFGRFRDLNVRSNPELDALVEQARRIVRGVTPQALRDSDSLRQEVASTMAHVRQLVEGLITEAPRRRLVRSRPSGDGGGHAAAD
ncbi:MAG TPA: hypothetical protein VFW33_06925 [Gemmataceae bacterium]|nr:hypothetical protein [Gemmataceae bacterium]